MQAFCAHQCFLKSSFLGTLDIFPFPKALLFLELSHTVCSKKHFPHLHRLTIYKLFEPTCLYTHGKFIFIFISLCFYYWVDLVWEPCPWPIGITFWFTDTTLVVVLDVPGFRAEGDQEDNEICRLVYIRTNSDTGLLISS